MVFRAGLRYGVDYNAAWFRGLTLGASAEPYLVVGAYLEAGIGFDYSWISFKIGVDPFAIGFNVKKTIFDWDPLIKKKFGNIIPLKPIELDLFSIGRGMKVLGNDGDGYGQNQHNGDKYSEINFGAKTQILAVVAGNNDRIYRWWNRCNSGGLGIIHDKDFTCDVFYFSEDFVDRFHDRHRIDDFSALQAFKTRHIFNDNITVFKLSKIRVRTFFHPL